MDECLLLSFVSVGTSLVIGKKKAGKGEREYDELTKNMEFGLFPLAR
jgi:hypothetical protein